ncbi:YpjP family protein [Bacillus shivajii]|uniref:YpjP family protein n=1 Tax=Bacillus shivajii TaxID=1983719 RepID=UPI001CF983D0|nr:YpjP family protein [Bacillus shivajii]UCZ53774.1 YpjP family protein [Bacillus shivajii]
MKLWLRKISVVLITLMTVGMYIPPTYLDNANANSDAKKMVSEDGEPKEDALTSSTELFDEDVELDIDMSVEADDESINDVIEAITEQAKEYTVTKLGPKIVEKVEDDVLTTVLPNIEEVLTMILEGADEDKLPYYGISESTSAYGEKIFHLYDYETEEDVAMFHVRRDKRPKEGYWFNFHYHLSNDDFQEHHNLGDIYWDKNTPPKWMS